MRDYRNVRIVARECILAKCQKLQMRARLRQLFMTD